MPFFFRPEPKDPGAAPRTLYSLQVGRGLAALLVLLYHANLIIGLPKYFGARPADIFAVGFAGVHYFFVLSGFVLVLAHWKDLHGPADLVGFAWKRFRRIYPLVWIILLPLMMASVVAPSLLPGNSLQANDYLAALAISPLPRIDEEPFLAVEWTLRYEIVFYFVFLLLLRSRLLFVLAAGPLVILGLAALAGFSDDPKSFWVSPFFLLFFMGMCGGWLFRAKPHVGSFWLLWPGLAGLLGCAWLIYRVGFIEPVTVAIGLFSALLVTGAAKAEKDRPSALSGVLTFLGDASYAIYLVHYPALSLATRIVVRLTDSPFLAFCLASLTSLIVGIVFHLLVERPLLQWMPRRLSSPSGHSA